MKSTVTAVDLGSSKVVTLIATHSDNGINECDFLGVGISKYEGYINGQWINPDELAPSIQMSIEEAKKQAGGRTKISEIYVGVPGEFSEIRVFNVRLNIQGADPRITPEHIDEIFKLADESFANYASNENYNTNMIKNVVVHRSPAWFIIDGEKKTLEPVGMKGREISAMVCFVTTNLVFTNHMNYIFNQLGYKVVGYYSSLTGQIKLYIPEEERDRMAAMIDVGYLGTDFVICEGDAIIYQERIPVGSAHILASMASGLNIPLSDNLEELKRKYQFEMFANQNNTYELQLQDKSGVNNYTQEDLDKCILPVVDSLCEKINESIEASGCNLPMDSKIYLTGGGIIKNRGAKEYVQSKLSRPVLELPNNVLKITEPYFSSSVGLVNLIMSDNATSSNNNVITGFFKKLFSI